MEAQITGVFESGLQKPINDCKILVVGAGGIGCELLKNVVLKGFNNIEIIDFATIDVSNVNSEFFSQKEQVGKSKANVAKESVLSFAPSSCNIVAHHDSIMKAEYDENFFKEFDLCFNTVINRDVRNHVTRMCIAANIPLLVSGTAGYFGQVAVINKGVTECYESFPDCTIRNTKLELVLEEGPVKEDEVEVVRKKEDEIKEENGEGAGGSKRIKLSPKEETEFDIASKSKAGNISPAIATTNAVIAGCIVMEAIKILNKVDLKEYQYELPPELWLRVLKMVPPQDLCSVMLSSRYMNSLASLPDLWAQTKVKRQMVMEKGLIQLYVIKRFEKINLKSIDFSRMGDWATPEKMLSLMNDIPETALEQVNFDGNDMSRVPAEALAKAVASLKSADLTATSLTTNQSSKVLEASLSSNSLEKIDLWLVDLSGVPADLLAKAVARLRSVDLRCTCLTTEQATSIMEAIQTSVTLVDISLSCVNLSGVPADLLANAVARLRSVDLSCTKVTTEQATSIMEAIQTSITLVDVDLDGVSLSGVPSDLLANAVARLRSVKLRSTCYLGLTREQSTGVVNAILTSITLVDVDLDSIDLSGVPSDLLANAVARLRSVGLGSTRLTAEQVTSIMEAILTSITLVDVNLDGIGNWVSLRGVPGDLLAKAVGRLHRVSLSCTGLTGDQCVAVGQAVASSSSLLQADLRGKQFQESLPAHLYDTLKLMDNVNI